MRCPAEMEPCTVPWTMTRPARMARFQMGGLRHDQRGFTHVDVSCQLSLDSEVFLAGQVAVEGDGCSDVGHAEIAVRMCRPVYTGLCRAVYRVEALVN